MAVPFTRLRCLALRCTSHAPARRKPLFHILPSCQFHTTPLHNREDDPDSNPQKPSKTPFVFSLSSLDPAERDTYQSLPPEERQVWREEAKAMHDYMTSPEVESELSAAASHAAYEAAREMPQADVKIPRIKSGLMAMGEVEEQDSGEDEEFEGDDITSLGHGELEQHREMREYARIAAWEMPLLSSTLFHHSSTLPLPSVANVISAELAKPFQPPTLDHPLRFRYTTYMGETHPAEKKIVLEFCTRDLPGLSEAQRIKLIKLAGPRYNPETDIVKMSSEMFETQAQNKRYLGDLVDTLMTEAKDESDMFEDVPLDFRHHRFKRKVEFPEGWKLSAERREQLEEGRWQRMVGERQRADEGRLVEGTSIIEEAMKALPVPDESRVLVEQQQGKRGKPKKGKQRLR
ncbi:37S ribosomal protein S24, mitochondrial [Mycoblastus sanguinarius]|nr:37S ribosomal protein S24, mitochondrial [Mycoblastus sanguinarius]